MNIVAKRVLLHYADQYPLAKTALLVWFTEFSKQKFEQFNTLKQAYGNASIVANQRVIFNIKGNDYRLIVSVNFERQSAYIIWFGNHASYDEIDAANVEFDKKLLIKK